MTKEEAKVITDQLNEKLDNLNKLVEDKAGADDLIKIQEEIKEGLSKCADKEYATKMQEHLDKIEGEVTKLAEQGASKGETREEQMEKVFKSDRYKSAKKSKGYPVDFEVKASTLTTSNSFTETNSKIIPAQRDPIIGIDPRNPLILTQLVSKGFIDKSDYIDWFERTGETDGSTGVAEAGAYGQSDASFTSYKIPVQKIGDYIVVAREKLEDTDWMQGQIMELLNYHVPNKLEYSMWNDDGSSNTQFGILGASTFNAAKTFAKPSGVEAVTAATKVDVLAAAILQISLGSNTSNVNTSLAAGFMANGIVLNPADYYNMSRAKDSNNRPLFDLNGVMRVNGVPIYQSTRVSAGTYVVGDFSRAKLYMRRNMTINVWDQNSTNAIYDLVTITASNRACFAIKNVDLFAFVTGTFAAGIEALA